MKDNFMPCVILQRKSAVVQNAALTKLLAWHRLWGERL